MENTFKAPEDFQFLKNTPSQHTHSALKDSTVSWSRHTKKYKLPKFHRAYITDDKHAMKQLFRDAFPGNASYGNL